VLTVSGEDEWWKLDSGFKKMKKESVCIVVVAMKYTMAPVLPTPSLPPTLHSLINQVSLVK